MPLMAQTHQMTSNQRMADAVLKARGTNLREYLTELHQSGHSLESIARELHDKTDGAVSLTFTTIRRWLSDLEIRQEAS